MSRKVLLTQNFGFETLAFELSLGNFAFEVSIGNFGFGTFAWELSLGSFVLRIVS